MEKKIKYYSLDKLYLVKKKILKKEVKQAFLVLIGILLCVTSFFLYKNSKETDIRNSKVNYTEAGEIDYKVYLKDNNYYQDSYLEKGMQYVASLIKTINIDYIYDLNTEKELNYNYDYTIKTNLKITEQNNKEKILYNKEEIIKTESRENLKNKSIHIDDDLDIDYGKYNDYVNSFKKDYGLSVSSDLEVILEIKLKGINNNKEKIVNNNRQLKVIVPLSEQTIDILIDTEEIKNTGTIELNKGTSLKTIIYLLITILFALLTTTLIIFILYYKNKKDVYKTKLDKILREYDRLIVEGKINIDENSYKNKIYPEKFEELVDASQILNVPILYYNVVPNHKCFFVVIKNDTIYKYRLTRAYQNKKVEEGNVDVETI